MGLELLSSLQGVQQCLKCPAQTNFLAYCFSVPFILFYFFTLTVLLSHSGLKLDSKENPVL